MAGMAAIHTCSCGARLRLPDRMEGNTFRCPQCNTEIEVIRPLHSFLGSSAPSPPLAPAVSTAPVPAPATTGPVVGTCPICQSAITEGEDVLRCPRCDQVHHRECWAEVGGCSTYGCEEAPAVEKEAPSPHGPQTAWGDTKRCPACGETIKAIALRCRYCRTDFDTVDPLTARDLRHKVRKAEESRGLQKAVNVLFIMALSGLLAPLALIGALILILPKRQQLARAGPFYLVLGYSTLGLSVLYCVLMALFLIIG